MIKNSTPRHRVDYKVARSMEALRALLANRNQAARSLQTEAALARLLEDCAQLLGHVEKSNAEFEELFLLHQSTLEHATDIENELELSGRNLNEDLSVAEKVQQALLPDPRVVFGSAFEVAIYHKQLKKVGGDFYDFFMLPDGRYAISVCDVSGHGVSAALVTTFLKAQFAQATKLLNSPGAILDWVNRSASGFLRGVRHYSSVAFVAFSGDFCRYVTGGGYGFMVRQQTPRPFKRTSNVIGMGSIPFQEYELPIGPGDTLALYTDGMFAAQGADETFYTGRRLNDLILAHQDKSPQAILDICIKDYVSFRQADADDITLVILRRRGP